MVSIKEKVDFVLRGGSVERFHTRPLIHKQNNAEHQYGVVSIAVLLDNNLHKDSILNFLWHDIYEGETGDIPYYSKKRWIEFKHAQNIAEASLKKQFSFIPNMKYKEDKITLKIAEYFDVLCFTIKETYLGNIEYITTIQECANLIRGLVKTYPTCTPHSIITNVYELLNQIRYDYEEKTGNKWNTQRLENTKIQDASNSEQEEKAKYKDETF